MANRRDWTEARAKCDEEGCCRNCGDPRVQAAHIWSRGMGVSMDRSNIIPLCANCHQRFDRHDLDILHLLTLEEQLAAVQLAGSIERARQRLAPSEYPRIP